MLLVNFKQLNKKFVKAFRIISIRCHNDIRHGYVSHLIRFPRTDVMALDNMKYIENHLDDQKPRRNRSKFHVLRDYKDVSAADLLKLLRDAGK